MAINRGGQALAKELQRRGWSLNRAERELKCANASVSRLVRGERTPGLTTALQIEQMFGVPPEWWLEPAIPAESGPLPIDPDAGHTGTDD